MGRQVSFTMTNQTTKKTTNLVGYTPAPGPGKRSLPPTPGIGGTTYLLIQAI